MKEETYRKAQIIISIVSIVSACLTFLFTGFIGVKNIIRQQQYEQGLELKKTMLNERISVYKNGCRIVGEISILAETKTDIKMSVNKFNEFYWGELGLIDDSLVVEKAKRFRFECNDFLESQKSSQDIIKLQKGATKFTEACKQSYIQEWHNITTDK